MLRRPHDHHRGVRAWCNATTSLDSSSDRDQDRDLMTVPQSRKPARRARWLSTGYDRTRPDIRPPPQIVRHRVRHHPPLTGQPLNCRTTRCIGSIQIRQLARGTQIHIAPAAPLYVPQARFPPLEAFGCQPPTSAAPPSCGRHPKPFTIPERRFRACNSGFGKCGHGSREHSDG